MPVLPPLFFPWPDPRWRRWRLIQINDTEHLCARASCATFEARANCDVQAWRESGTTDLEVLTTAGIRALEYQLLAADG
jgi:hypothetical protein